MSRPAVVVLLLVALLPAGPLVAQAQNGRAEPIAVHAYKLQHQNASEALMLIHSLLSPRGTVELQKEGNTLVVRDTVASLAKVVAVLHNFDRPALPLRLELYVVRASRQRVSGHPGSAALPAELVRRLRGLLPYEAYDVEGQAQLASAEGQNVTYEIGSGLEVSFRLGAVDGDGKIRLQGFRIVRRLGRDGPAKPIAQYDLTATLDQPTTVGLTKSEASPEALILVLKVRLDPTARPPRAQD